MYILAKYKDSGSKIAAAVSRLKLFTFVQTDLEVDVCTYCHIACVAV